MNGTRIARTAALTAALMLGAALTTAALLAADPSDGLHADPPTAALTGTPVLLRSADQGATAGTPRTTPPPTVSEPTASTSAATPGRPAAATTVGGS